MKYIHVVYHANCLDGFCSYWLAQRALSRPGSKVVAYPASYGPSAVETAREVTDAIHAGTERGGDHHQVLIVDFSFTGEILDRISAIADEVVVLDHHQTPIDLLAKYYQEHIQPKNLTLQLDTSYSGAGLTAKYLRLGALTPKLALHVQDRDLWQFALPATREIMAYVASHPYDLKAWDQINAAVNNDLAGVLRTGSALLRARAEEVDSVIRYGLMRVMFHGHNVPVINAFKTFASDIGQRLAEEPFVVTWTDTAQGREFSLRSQGKVDVEAIARSYGGGGHFNAAGFTMPRTVDGIHPDFTSLT